ncbi:MAG: dihydroorotate dehydrogenase electron transfer subunit [Oscillospiraceae bacterium]
MSAAFYNAIITENKKVAEGIYLLTAKGISPMPKAGQFYMLRTWAQNEPPLLSRPISVFDCDNASGTVSFLYEMRGIGTQKLSCAKAGDTLQLTGASGNGFPTEKLRGKIALIGGGIGIAPLYLLAKALKAKGCNVELFAGFRDVPYMLDAFALQCSSVSLATDSGNYGTKGFVTDLFNPTGFDAVCICGPEIMMEKAARACMEKGVAVYVSKEAKMACGVGACLGCTCKTIGGGKSVCKDGPVFEGGEVYA